MKIDDFSLPVSFIKGTAFGCLLLTFTSQSVAQPGPALPDPASEKGLFDSDDMLPITLRGNVRQLLKNRSENPETYPLVLTYIREDSTAMDIPVGVKTRGHFRKLKGNCLYPPLMIQFPNEGPHLSSVFREQKKLKLVTPCKNDRYILGEWLAYKLYNLLTPLSFRTRLVQVKLEDDKNKKSYTPFYGILLEETAQMAARNRMIAVEPNLKPQQTEKNAFLRLAVFEYLIGNTDWSVQYLQNIKLLATDSSAVPVAVPYDFDHSGIVNAPYARPAAELEMSSVRERRYRGYCVQDLKVFENVIAQYNQLKQDIYRTYTGCALLDAKYIKSTTQYLDAFYSTINNPKAWQNEFAYPCDPNGTGNVVIQGLKKNE